MSDALWDGRRFRTFNVIDDFTRECLAIETDLKLPAQRVIRVLDRIAAWRGYPAKLRLDNGSEFIATAVANWAEVNGIVLDVIESGKPTQSGFIERFNGSCRSGVLDMYVFRNLTEVRERTERWRAHYHEQIPHLAICHRDALAQYGRSANGYELLAHPELRPPSIIRIKDCVAGVTAMMSSVWLAAARVR